MSENDGQRVGRREALVGIGATVSALGMGCAPLVSQSEGAPSSADAQGRPDLAAAHGLAPADTAVHELFGPLVGAAIGERWRLDAVYAVRYGAIPVVMRTASGERFAMEIFLADESASANPPATVGSLALFLSNRGHGASATNEEHGLGARALAASLGERVARGARVPSGLSTHAEHRRRYPTAIAFIPA